MMWRLGSHGGHTAVIDEAGNEYSYGLLERESDRLARNIRSGRCLIFNLCTNAVGSLLGYVAGVNHEIVPLLLDARLDRGMLAALTEAYRPDYLWVPSEMVSEFPYTAAYEAFGYTLLKTPYTKAYPLYDELALLLTTSGSTGSPKLVRQSYANLRANTASIVEYLRLDASERPITTLPMSYTYGLSIINTHLAVGAPVILTQKTLMQREFWEQFRHYGATSFGGVPYTYEILDRLRFTRMELPSLRTMTQAGGKLPPELHKKLALYAEQTGKRFIVMYGQTEATARMAYLPAEMSAAKYGSMGVSIPGGAFFLRDEQGGEITQAGETGELIYQGANVALGYALGGADLAKGDDWGGKLATGDMAYRDADGYYYIVGRKKRFLKIFGSRVNLDETERMVKSRFADTDCACAGVDDAMYVMVTDPGIAGEVAQYLAEKTGLNRSAFQVRHIGAIPKSESGKTLYAALEKYYVQV